MTPHLWVSWSVQPMRSVLSENWPIGAAHTMLVPQTGVIASGWTSQCLILQKGECHSWTLEWRGSVRRVSLNKKTFIRISCKEIGSNSFSKTLKIWRSDDGKVCQGGQQQHGEEWGSWPGGELCHDRPDFHLNVVVLSLFQYLAGHQSAPYMTSVGSKPEEWQSQRLNLQKQPLRQSWWRRWRPEWSRGGWLWENREGRPAQPGWKRPFSPLTN